MVQQKETFGQLSCGEVLHIWMGVQHESLHRCGITFFLQHIEDNSVRELLDCKDLVL